MSVQEMKPIKEGKVREIYDNGDTLIMVATDRISCFDVILDNTVTKKGTVLTQMSKFWFDMTEDVIPNHMVSADVKDMPEFFRQPKFDGNSMMCKKLNMLPIECIVRGYITGSGWESYKTNGTVCGIKLPEGLKEADKLPEPIYTPSTKAEIGDHDENISYEQSVEYLEKRFPGKGAEYAAKLRDYMVLGDEVLTPYSSRFWPVDGYEPGHGQPSFDKQFARDWLKANPEKGWKAAGGDRGEDHRQIPSGIQDADRKGSVNNNFGYSFLWGQAGKVRLTSDGQHLYPDRK